MFWQQSEMFGRIFLAATLLSIASCSLARAQHRARAELIARRDAAFEQTRRFKEERERRLEKMIRAGIEDVASIRRRGEASRMLDIVIIPDGFSSAKQRDFDNQARRIARQISAISPFARYRNYINFHKINLVSKVTTIAGDPRLQARGRADEGEPRTPLRSRVRGAIRALSCDRGRAEEYARYAPDADLIAVVANVTGVRSTGGGGIITLANGKRIDNVAIHELGHAFGGLADEYVDAAIAAGKRDSGREPGAPNVTREPNPRKAKWHYWFYHPLKGVTVGCFEGALYRARGYYRPQKKCRMRNASSPFCVVCCEQMEKRFYRFIDPIEDFSPRTMKETLWLDDEITFQVQIISLERVRSNTGRFDADWFIDGVPTKQSRSRWRVSSLRLKASMLGPGTHEVVVNVDFHNRRVRRDNGYLSSNRGWVVEVLPFKRPSVEAPKEITVRPGDDIHFKVVVGTQKDAEPFSVEAISLPDGAAFDEAVQEFRWKPEEKQRGAYQSAFWVGNEKASITVRTRIIVSSPGRENRRPLFQPIVKQDMAEGYTLFIPLKARDPDGDHLLYSCDDIPCGAVLDSGTGDFVWGIGLWQAGRHDLAFRVTDGRRSDHIKVEINVSERTLRNAEDVRLMTQDEWGELNSDVYQALRSTRTRVRLEAIETLDKCPRGLALSELIRFLRSEDSRTSDAAVSKIGSFFEDLSSGEMGSDALVWSDPRARYYSLYLSQMQDYCWQLTDNESVLDQIGGMIESASSLQTNERSLKAAIQNVRKTLKDVREYNGKRGVKTLPAAR